jgi:hypothetical protein
VLIVCLLKSVFAKFCGFQPGIRVKGHNCLGRNENYICSIIVRVGLQFQTFVSSPRNELRDEAFGQIG